MSVSYVLQESMLRSVEQNEINDKTDEKNSFLFNFPELTIVTEKNL
jgi:hypothetical protein